jgi:hypothetical protein
MDEIWLRVMENMSDRVTGPMKFRLFLQPIMAASFAIVAGLKDARAGRPPYFWALFTQPEHRVDMIREGWRSVGKVFILAVLLDIAYQIIVARFVYPGEVVLVAFALAIVPYLILRGLINRIAARALQ